jgi:hypothetical protein
VKAKDEELAERVRENRDLETHCERLREESNVYKGRVTNL